MAKDTERQTSKTCAMCVNRCKQGPECTIISCREFKKKDKDPKPKH